MNYFIKPKPEELSYHLNDYFSDLDNPSLVTLPGAGNFDISFRRADADTDDVPSRLEFPKVVVRYRDWEFVGGSNHEGLDVHCEFYYGSLRRDRYIIREEPAYRDAKRGVGSIPSDIIASESIQ